MLRNVDEHKDEGGGDTPGRSVERGCVEGKC